MRLEWWERIWTWDFVISKDMVLDCLVKISQGLYMWLL